MKIHKWQVCDHVITWTCISGSKSLICKLINGDVLEYNFAKYCTVKCIYENSDTKKRKPKFPPTFDGQTAFVTGTGGVSYNFTQVWHHQSWTILRTWVKCNMGRNRRKLPSIRYHISKSYPTNLGYRTVRRKEISQNGATLYLKLKI